MASKPKSVSTLRRRRKRLFNRLAPLLQLDLFQKPDGDTERAIAELKAGIATTTREVDELLEARRVG
jgi:hypothetical protein